METFIIFQGTNVFYRTFGHGQMVVLLHGFGEDGNIWQHQVLHLQKYFQIIVPDLPGSGRSPLLNNGSIEVYATIIHQIIITEQQKNLIYQKDKSCAVIGHSMGGYITLAIAEKYPGLLNSFGLFHSSAFADNKEKILARKKSIDFITTNGANAFLQTSIPGLFYQPDSSPDVNWLLKNGAHFTAETLIQYYEAMINRPDRIAVLQQSLVPVLFIIGQHDKAIPFETSLQQCYLPAQSHVHILRHSAHMGMLEEAEKCNDILLQFLQMALVDQFL